jgi:hypothetical protein
MKDEFASNAPSYEVIALARDTRGVLLNGSDSEQIYLPMPGGRLQDFPILIRTQGDPTQIMKAIRPIVLSIDPDIATYTFTLEEMLRQTESFLASTLGRLCAGC